MGASQQALLCSSSAGVTDPFFSSVVLLLHFNESNGATTFTDSSSQATNPSQILATSSVTTTGPQFGTGCLNNVAGTSSTTQNAARTIGTQDFTWEFSFFTTNPSQVKNICDVGGETSGPTIAWLMYISSSQYVFYQNATDRIRGGTVSNSAWDQIRLARASGTTRLWVNGVFINSYVDGNNYSRTGGIFIGGEQGASLPCTAKFDECRFTVGVARSSTNSNYTPDTAAFPDS